MELTAFYTTEPLKETLQGIVDVDYVNGYRMRLTVGAVNARMGNMRYYDSQHMPLESPILWASGALPPAFPAGGSMVSRIGTGTSIPIRQSRSYYTTVRGAVPPIFSVNMVAASRSPHGRGHTWRRALESHLVLGPQGISLERLEPRLSQQPIIVLNHHKIIRGSHRIDKASASALPRRPADYCYGVGPEGHGAGNPQDRRTDTRTRLIAAALLLATLGAPLAMADSTGCGKLQG